MKSSDYYTVSIRNKKLIVTGQNIHEFYANTNAIEKMRALGSLKYSGRIQAAGRRIIENRFYCWFKVLEYDNELNKMLGIKKRKRFVLITLTLPTKQMHTDEELKLKALKPFINKLMSDKGVKNWTWKAEKQDNGNIHFHIVLDTYIDKAWIDKTWFHYMRRLGYMSLFYSKYGFVEPPSCNVKGQDEMRNPVSYLTKYFEKNEEKKPVSGAVWRMSKNLLLLENFRTDVSTTEVKQILERAKKLMLREFDDDFFHITITYKPLKWSDLGLSYFLEARRHWKVMSQRLKTGDKMLEAIGTRETASLENLKAAEFKLSQIQPEYEQLAIPDFEGLDVARFTVM